MGLMHIRTPKHFVLEERLERYADGFEAHPERYAGRWAEACRPLEADPASPRGLADGGYFSRVVLDIGCGKGSFIIQAARQDPATLFLGMDAEPLCIAYAAQYIVESGLPNVLAIPRDADAARTVFAPGEIDAITLNFSTPHPRAHDAHRRLTTVERLIAYRSLLAADGTLTVRTDSQPFRDWTLTQLAAAGFRTLWTSDDDRADHPDSPISEYEVKLAERGAVVWSVCATPGPEPTAEMIARGHEANPSLMTYLPDDLESLTYVPLGMEDAVKNFINRRRRAARRAAAAAARGR